MVGYKISLDCLKSGIAATLEIVALNTIKLSSISALAIYF
jgi:hypothetical protein